MPVSKEDIELLRKQRVVYATRSDAECEAALEKRPGLITKPEETKPEKKTRKSRRGETREERGGQDRAED